MSRTADTAESETVGESMAGQDDVLFEIRDLKTYYEASGLFGGIPVKAVDGVSFDIRRGETLGVVGESGCGKTTLGRTIVQLEKSTSGEIRYEDIDITELRGDDLHEWRRNAQIVFQDPDSSLNHRLTVGDIIREPLDVHEWKTPKERRQRVRDLLEMVGLQPEHYYRYPHQFSGGQRQRIGIARTLALEPDFIVLDEPVSALDVSVQAEIINLLEDLQDEHDLTYLFIAHDLSVVRHICDRVAVMYLGHIMEIGPTEELFQNPSNPYTHALLSAIPTPDPTVEIDRITLKGTPPNPRYPPSGCPFNTRCPARIRPEEYEHLDNELWVQLTILREIIQERKRAVFTVRERLRRRMGWSTRFATVEQTFDELFGDIEVPDEVWSVLDEIKAHIDAYDEESAIELWNKEFGSVCESEPPEFHSVSSTGCESYCHRHLDEYPEPEDVLRTRF